MWQTDWAETPREQGHSAPLQASAIDVSSIVSTYLLSWTEHCIECAVPDCFALCPLYVRRRDRKCARFKNGIFPNPNYPGLFPYGAEVEFRRWGKLESTFGYGSVSVSYSRGFDRIDRMLLRVIRPISSLLRPVNPALRLNGAYTVGRERLLQAITRHQKTNFDEFVIEVWNVGSNPVGLVLETWQQGLKFRTSMQLEPGRNIQQIPCHFMNIDLYGTFGMIRVYPENDAEAHLIFSWLDFVRYAAPQRSVASIETPKLGHLNAESASKVKCVIWDLDQTAWDGILGEQDADRITLRPAVLATMRAFDKRGILQSVASKNDHRHAWLALRRLGVAHLLLYPQINWEPKSLNVQRIVSALNIGVDSCAFIDDSEFELAEVAQGCPGIRVFHASDVSTLLKRPEFDVPVTHESKQRRSSYQAESQRREKATEYGDRYEAFLKSCEMEARLFRLAEPEHIERCLELLHRSNQLNLSTYRYTREEFTALLQRNDVICVCTSSRDRFGEYGIVGFASLELTKERIVLRDFVLSCRVAQKKLENAWFKRLCDFARDRGYSRIYAPYRETSRNCVLLQTFLEVGFVENAKNNVGALLELDASGAPPFSDIVSIVAHVFDSPEKSASLLATG